VVSAKIKRVKEALNKSRLWFHTFSVRPECRAQRGVSKGRTENTHHERIYSARPKHKSSPAARGDVLGVSLATSNHGFRFAVSYLRI